MVVILDIVDGELIARRDGEVVLILKKVSDLYFYLNLTHDPPVVMCSSSLDFPKEYTSDPEVIRMCDQLRGGE